ncbi:patatin-like phospholipase family protein [Geomonas nitrogeniifigens]|uniref:Patatin-like phospholipase family protein n=1 Tax=Geomonas diazotrophica TaxID=2843197 RepID=A0ABX8JHX8_9BACT|nr:patatin-like phospholipase family protein [Geomonas nitrogeniifigens]QWV97988.1 patatin-like phospholipase family protein [Geomonas nitrogeniifigens]
MKATTLCRVYLRSGPRNVLAYPRKVIPAGAEVTVLELAGEWLKVGYLEKEGFLRRDSVELEPGSDREYYELPEVLLRELAAIRESRGEEGDAGQRALPAEEDKESRLRRVIPQLHAARLTALCLSGGGIRSATFNLGVLQGLARCGLLGKVDYLSTVSGGGYIGSWLSSWISRETGTAKDRLDKVTRVLAQQTEESRRREPYQVRFLRDYSNYLTPRVGMFSVDTWSIIGTYLRNLLLNWLVLIPMLFTFLLLPRLLVLLVSGQGMGTGGGEWLLWGGGCVGILPIAYTVIDLPSIGDGKLDKGYFIAFFLVPLLLMAVALPSYWGCSYLATDAAYPDVTVFIGFAISVHLGGWVAGHLWLWAKKVSRPLLPAAVFFVCAALTGAVAGALGWVAATRLLPVLLTRVAYPELLFAVLSVPLVLADYLLTGTLLVALLSRFTGDQDREWWGRAGGVTIMAGLAWAALLALVVYGPWLILPESHGLWKKLYALLGGGAGIAAALMGKNAATPALRPGISMDRVRTQLPAAAAVLFLLFLVQAVSLAATCLLWWGELPWSPGRGGIPSDVPLGVGFLTHLYLLANTPAPCLLWLAAATASIWLLMALMVNINSFSMHAMYRNRLVRCYLGASRRKEERCPNPFTGFDRNDDRAMVELGTRPFHVVNMAWNLVKGKRLAWQQRKAASFTMTPLFAGSDLSSDDRAKGVKPGGYRDMDSYGAGWVPRTAHPTTLGTAMAISGAAASPNMGYHSSSLVTFVMAFFNVRLGWWLGNPGTGMHGAWRKASPGLALIPLLKETFGFTREDGKDIYLSDGGHFENLGLYEMVRRRCRYMVVCDAGCDCDGRFEDLGNAVRKVRADFGVEIDIDLAAVRAKKLHFAVGTVRYGCCGEEEADEGCVLYLKPVLTGDESADLLNYGRVHAEFPHEPTADQWFDEAQFESYRKLGLHSVLQLTGGGLLELEECFSRAGRLHRRALKELDQRHS